MRILKIVFIALLIKLSFLTVVAQEIQSGMSYTMAKLSQEPVKVIGEVWPENSREVGDTTFTIYSGASVDFKTYFVNGMQYDNIFNPNPTGMYINGKEFLFYCSMEKSIRLNYNNILEAKEFEFLGKRYLMVVSFREDCLGDNCRYRCYNLFDISNERRVFQTSFSSVFQGIDSFGEFNNDGKLDFLRVALKPSQDAVEGSDIDHYLITAYTAGKSSPKQLTDQGHSYYLYVNGDYEVYDFMINQAYWFFEVRDSKGEIAKPTKYFAEYISFDPLYQYLYNPDGVRIEKNNWSIKLVSLGDLEAAQEYCREIQEKEFEDVYIMIDQYSGDITFQVFVGNFISKDGAEREAGKLTTAGIDGDLFDLRRKY
ncbi:SPOR domain-containing protein [Sediminitomix flava]|uniref:Sporulation related protein n=1 Tax=Sediminitomix flava TaxID=379075 RepID=A0A315ZB50_SEDFL|nr:SPOR domain-containing protein [Sediminitomix flava]PWJ42283.1 sporulation related protein [Sediminitomix flava]